MEKVFRKRSELAIRANAWGVSKLPRMGHVIVVRYSPQMAASSR